MKCMHCGVELSYTVCLIHQKKCIQMQERIGETSKEIDEPKIIEDLNMEEITNLTKPKIMEALKQRGVKFDRTNKREVLEALLIENME